MIQLEKNKNTFIPIALSSPAPVFATSSSGPTSRGQDKEYKFEFTPSGKIAVFGFGSTFALDFLGSYALGVQQALPVGSSLFKRALVAVAVKGGIGGTLFIGSLTVGLLVGRGIDFLPTVWGGERVSDKLSKFSYGRLGNASPWLMGAAEFIGLD